MFLTLCIQTFAQCLNNPLEVRFNLSLSLMITQEEYGYTC